MHARLTIRKRGTQDEEAQVYLTEKILPQARQLDGFKGVIDLTDPTTDEGYTLTLWESEEAMQASEEAASQIRSTAAADLGETVLDVKRLKVDTLEIG